MKDYSTPWTKDELKAYILIYCANADYHKSNTEVSFIKSHTNIEDFDKIQREFDQDNDFISIQKIQWAIKHHGYNDAEIDNILKEIKTMFIADEHFDILEQNLYGVLKRILKTT